MQATQNTTAEFELLRLCCRPTPDVAHDERLAALLSGPMDWDGLIVLARRHAMLPGLYASLSKLAWRQVPTGMAGRIKAFQRKNLIHSLSLLKELLRLLDSFNRSSIRVLPIKGPVLARLAYGDLGARAFHDLDVLIAQDDVSNACRLLAGLGYAPEVELNGGNIRAYAAQERHLTLNNCRTGLPVELQWGLAPGYFHCPYDFEELWRNRRSVSLENRRIATLSDTGTMRFLCMHGFKHGWDRLNLVSDLAHFLSRTRPSLRDITRPGEAGLQLVERLVPGTVSGEMMAALGRDGAARCLAGRWQRDLLSKKQQGGRIFANGRMYVAGQQGIGRKVLFLWRLLFTPTVEDWKYWGLKRSWRLYPVLRPLRLVARYML